MVIRCRSTISYRTLRSQGEEHGLFFFIPLPTKNEVVQVAPPHFMREDSMEGNRNEIDQVVKMAILDSNLIVLALYILHVLILSWKLVQNSYFSFHDVLVTKRVVQSLCGHLYCLAFSVCF